MLPSPLVRAVKRLILIVVCFMLISNIIQLVRVVLTSPDVASSAQSTKDGLPPKKLKQDKLLNYSTVTLEPWKHKGISNTIPPNLLWILA
ncbi:hypothetical protein BCR33DRAFT_212096 [Rhizoclosmatium globosum]|uniref:Uncharacterized protein n=1 Tax=Rhizoclosmatium globosum TaxID=329046 RepID=A0A1Y2CCY5_9FUNG|nr:hypothetical protein BCR33DRAFT_212096 [Rhizoclosmatium globosum]|eukprot:ORY44910.1 hypothetical protein BCR33DRAFT_212096 [Rhizoclosmatium globosum]